MKKMVLFPLLFAFLSCEMGNFSGEKEIPTENLNIIIYSIGDLTDFDNDDISVWVIISDNNGDEKLIRVC